MSSRLGSLLCALVLGAPGLALAQNTAGPLEVVKVAVEGVIGDVKTDAAAQNGDVNRIAALVEAKFLPHTDFLETTRLAVGAPWQTASEVQRRAVFEEFQKLLVRTYATEITQVTAQNLTFHYQPVTLAPAATDAVVKTQMVTPGDDAEIDYRLTKTPGGWRIYDINILGAWLSTLYRHQFAAGLATGGMDGLAKTLAAHNRRQAADP